MEQRTAKRRAIGWVILLIMGVAFVGSSCRRAATPEPPALKPKEFKIHPTKKGLPRWIFTASERIVSTPRVGVNTIYVSSLDRKLFAVDSRTGKKKWIFDKIDDLVLSSPETTPDGSTIYIVSRDHHLYAIDESGKEKWRFRTDGPIDSSPKLGIDGTIYIASHDAKLYALDPNLPPGAKKPKTKWVYQGTEKFRRSSPEFSTVGDTIYIASEDGSLHAIPANQTSKNAKAKWVRKICDKITSSPKTDPDGTIYIGCWGRYPSTDPDEKLKGELKAIKANGDRKWSFPTDAPVLATPQLGLKGNIYFGSDDTYFYAINKKGEKIWAFRSGVYKVVIPKAKKGKKKAKAAKAAKAAKPAKPAKPTYKRVEGSEAYIQATAAISPKNGNIFFGSINEYLYALKPTGELRWQFDARGWVDNAPVIHGNGDIIYVAAGNRLFAMNP